MISPIQGSQVLYLRTERFGSLDGLRAVAILSVLWLHTTNASPPWIVLRRGFLGVDFFFIISGFLIATLLLRERRSTGSISLPAFYLRRILRICPAYCLMLLVVACVAFSKAGATSHVLRRDLPYAALYMSNLVPLGSFLSITWSLSAEEQFYLLAPAFVKRASAAVAHLALPALWLIAVLPSFGVLPGVQMPEFFRQTTFGPILMGIMLAYVLNDPIGWSFFARFLKDARSPLVALAAVIIACSYPGSDISGLPRVIIHISLTLLLASCVVREQHALTSALTWLPLRRIGVVSYGMYLYHMVVYWPVHKVLEHAGIRSGYALFVCLTAATWAAAELSYATFERRFLAVKNRLPREPGYAPHPALDAVPVHVFVHRSLETENT